MNTFKKTLVALISITLLSGLSACTAPEAYEASPTPQAVLDGVMFDESAVVNHMGLTEENGSWYLTIPDTNIECEAAVILTTDAAVSLYADAGDAVPTNPDRTAGVKNVSEEMATCQAFFTERLADFPLPDGETKAPFPVAPVEEVVEEVHGPDYIPEVREALVAHLGMDLGTHTTFSGVVCEITAFITNGAGMEDAMLDTDGITSSIVSNPIGDVGVITEGPDLDACIEYFIEALSDFEVTPGELDAQFESENGDGDTDTWSDTWSDRDLEVLAHIGNFDENGNITIPGGVKCEALLIGYGPSELLDQYRYYGDSLASTPDGNSIWIRGGAYSDSSDNSTCTDFFNSKLATYK